MKYIDVYYLKQKLKDKYCIILSTGYKGKIRFDCKCDDGYCLIEYSMKNLYSNQLKLKNTKI